MEAGELLGEEEVFLRRRVVDDDHVVAQLEGRLHRVGEPRAEGLDLLLAVLGLVGDDEPIHHRLYSVLLVPVEFDMLVHVPYLAVDPDADETRLAHILEDPLVVAFAVFDEGRQYHHLGLGLEFHHRIYDLLC